MQIKLCYKEYQAKMTLEAIKYYDQETGRDLWSDLVDFLGVWQVSMAENPTSMKLCSDLYKSMTFINASHIFRALITGVDSSRSLLEIQDAMFAVGWLPSSDDTGLAEPWPLIMYKAALDVNSEMLDFAKKKKLAALGQ